MVDDIPNTGLSRDARTFPLTCQVQAPEDNLVCYAMVNAPWPFEVIEIYYFIEAGGCEFIAKADGQDIDTTETDSTGTHLCDSSTPVTAYPDGSHYAVGEGGSLTVAIDQVESDSTNLVIQFVCRRTDEDVVISP